MTAWSATVPLLYRVIQLKKKRSSWPSAGTRCWRWTIDCLYALQPTIPYLRRSSLRRCRSSPAWRLTATLRIHKGPFWTVFSSSLPGSPKKSPLPTGAGVAHRRASFSRELPSIRLVFQLFHCGPCAEDAATNEKDRDVGLARLLANFGPMSGRLSPCNGRKNVDR